MDNIEIIENHFSNVAEVIEYTPDPIDEYMVIVNDVNDWEEIHNYIINENEIDGIPNRKIECANLQEFSLRTAIYLISQEEADILRTHEKIETVELNPDKYPQPSSLMLQRFANNIAFNKPLTTLQRGASSNTSISYTNGVRGNWSHLFLNNPGSLPFRGVGVTTTTKVDSNLSYTLDGTGVDAVIIDEGVAYLHPEFLDSNGNTRVKDVILDGPYKVDPDYFTTRGLTYTKIVDGVNVGVGIATASALEWWSTPSKRSVQFQSLGTVFIDSRYNLAHVSTKTSNSNGNQISGGHGTACASQIGGKSFGLAFNCNIWNIRIMLGGVEYVSGTTALNICAIFHNAKKISQNNNPDPTLINNSWGSFSVTGNTSGTTYTIGYRGNTQTYVGSGSGAIPPTNCGSARNNSAFYYKNGSFTNWTLFSSAGQYLASSSSNTGAENAIAAGCVVVASAGNDNQKLSDPTDLDYNNWYGWSTNYINRAQGVQKGGSGDITKNQGSIRVGALDCAVEPVGSSQGATAYSVRKVCYSNNGPMINVWAPAEMTMAAGYTSSYERFVRLDNSAFYDTYFNGTSSAGPNACSLIALYLQGNRASTTDTTRSWLASSASKADILSDPYPSTSSSYYWSSNVNNYLDTPNLTEDSYNVRGCGNLRGATNSVLTNPFTNYIFGNVPSSINEGSSGTFNLNTTNISNGTTLYWTINHVTTTGADFSATSGSFTINSNTGSFNITTIADSATEGGETFTVSIRTDSTSGTVVAISSSVTINDTSVGVSYTFGSIPSSINEGSSGTFNVNTTSVSNGTTLYWSIIHVTSIGADFSATSGSFTINSNTGSFNITPIADSLTEGSETFTVSVLTGSPTGTIVATSNSVTVNDTSIGVASFIFGSIPSSINEGASGTFNLDTTNISNGTTLYWSINHVTSIGADFSATSGSFTINSNTGSFSITPIEDSLTEGPETFTVSVLTGSPTGTIVATSNSVTINDTSTTPPPPPPIIYNNSNAFATGGGLSFTGVIISLE
jgi:hypothetical protein